MLRAGEAWPQAATLCLVNQDGAFWAHSRASRGRGPATWFFPGPWRLESPNPKVIYLLSGAHIWNAPLLADSSL